MAKLPTANVIHYISVIFSTDGLPASGLPNTSFESDETDPAQVYDVTDDNAENDNWEQARLDCIRSDHSQKMFRSPQ